MSITEITGFCVLAKARVGSNGSVSGVAECLTGKTTGVSTGRKTWDTNLANGLDSGLVAVSLTLDASGAHWAVGGAAPTTIDFTASWGEIQTVTLQAAVSGLGRRFSFDSVVIAFFTHSSDTVPDETLTLAGGDTPVADTMSNNQPDAEQITECGPDGSGYKKIVVTANIRLQGTATNLPSSEGLFGAIYVFTDTCS